MASITIRPSKYEFVWWRSRMSSHRHLYSNVSQDVNSVFCSLKWSRDSNVDNICHFCGAIWNPLKHYSILKSIGMFVVFNSVLLFGGKISIKIEECKISSAPIAYRISTAVSIHQLRIKRMYKIAQMYFVDFVQTKSEVKEYILLVLSIFCFIIWIKIQITCNNNEYFKLNSIPLVVGPVWIIIS